LYANMNQRDKMMSEYRTLVSLKPTAEDKANADYLVASFDYKQWDRNGADTGTNRDTRLRAEGALMGYFNQNRNAPGAGRFLVEAGWAVFKMKRAGGEGDWKTWAKNTTGAWDNFRAKAPTNKD